MGITFTGMTGLTGNLSWSLFTTVGPAGEQQTQASVSPGETFYRDTRGHLVHGGDPCFLEEVSEVISIHS